MEGMTLQKKNKIKEKPTSMIPYGKAFMSSLRFSKDDTITRVAFNARKSSKPKMTMSLEYLPYVRTCEGSSDEPSTLNLRYCLQEEEITGEKECRDKKDFFPSIGFFPYYRSQDEFLNNTILRHRFGRKHSIKFRNEEKRGDANRKFANHNCGVSLFGIPSSPLARRGTWKTSSRLCHKICPTLYSQSFKWGKGKKRLVPVNYFDRNSGVFGSTGLLARF
ncbi:uncharacterized protein LOC141519285 isoform X2 [Macrotis lagotis]|uniref:uncharacterized protein LOC141519285 isoform X2 n=1 Tax=Macrotis lagotis TaxID=92651 RepID=UPI003D68DF2C